MKVLSHHNLIAPIRAINGFSTCIFLGALIDEDGTARTCYIKAFVPGSRGLTGELTGWILSGAAGLRQPTAAWIILIEPRFLAALWPEIDWGNELTPCWASLQLDCPSPENMPARASKRLQRELRQWSSLPLAISMVEWLANGDANAGNLLRLAPGEFAMLDWAEAFGGQFWTAEQLPKIEWVYNKMAYLAGYIGPQLAISPADANRVMQAAAKHNIALLASETALFEWLSDLIGTHETSAALAFLRQRAGLENSKWHSTTKKG